MKIHEDDYLAHYGTLHKSGRYPWGSGETPNQRNRSFLDHVEALRKAGLTDPQIVEGLGLKSTTELRALKSIAKNQVKQDRITQAQRLKNTGMSNMAIAREMKINESSVRSLLQPSQKDKADILESTANMLRAEVDKQGMIDVGTGVENHLGISATKLSTAVAVLKEEGYVTHKVQVDQLGTSNKTTILVLAPKGTEYKDIVTNMDKIGTPLKITEDEGRSYYGNLPPMNLSLDRVGIRYAEDGGSAADGVMYVRPGVKDVSLGNARYAQVRIAVGGTHYIKGMAMYKEDLPKGVDVLFNTNKKKADIGSDKLKALKEMKKDDNGDVDQTNPFGAITRQIGEKNAQGHVTKLTSVMNLVNEEGDWGNWSKSLSTQVLSKQSPLLAKTQLDMTFERRQNELASIMALTNPTVRRKLLDSYADGTDSAAIHLKAAAMPRQATHVILPIDSLKSTEVYAPNYRNGERVALIRYPHGGKFEIPELTVNNNHPESKTLLGRATDAIGINSKVAERLSGADFDGDTVLVIPNNARSLKSESPLAKLKDFAPQTEYKAYEGMPKMDARTKGMQMGLVSNLITDMTIMKASNAELAQAVRHSMVVIDAEKHHLDYRRSAKDHGISDLMRKYQGRPQGGAATLISRATSPTDVNRRKLRGVDKETGEKIFLETGETKVIRKTSKRTGITTTEVVPLTQKSVKLAETKDAHTLVSDHGGTVIEKVYADHSNRLKALANQARKESANTPLLVRSPSARVAHAAEVASLNAKLNTALMNRPLERRAQLIANTTLRAKKAANPDWDKAQEKKEKAIALEEARNRTGAKKAQIRMTPAEWAAVQAGAISDSKLKDILDNADLEQVKELATPKVEILMTSAKQQRAEAMLASGYTQADVADTLGVSVTTLKNSVGGKR